MLRLESLSCGYGPMRAVHNLDLKVKSGSIMALLGANGAGKSSTIMCIAGHVKVFEGRVIYDDTPITHWTPVQRVNAHIGLVPEGRRLFSSLTVRENLVVGGYCRQKRDTAAGIDRVVQTFPRLGERFNQPAGLLSGGEQQKVAVARAVVGDPKSILADEPTGSLDADSAEVILNLLTDIHARGATVLVATHDKELIRNTKSRVVQLKEGKFIV